MGSTVETTETSKEIYLEVIAAGGDYAEASHAAGVDRITGWRWRKNPEFAAKVREARKVSVQHLIEEAERRALRGSDKLLEFLLCNYAPERFRKAQSLAISGSLDLGTMSEEQIRAELATLTGQATVTEQDDGDGSDLV